MPEGRSAPYRVRIAGQEILFPDLDAIRRLFEDGQIGASAEVRPPGSDAWIPVAQALAAPRARRDPWAAWEEAEEVDPADIWKQFASPKSEAPPAPPPDELPPAALSPLPDESPAGGRSGPRFVIDASKRNTGKVLAFPGRGQPRSRPEVAGPHALAPVEQGAPAEPVPLRPRPSPTPAPLPASVIAPTPAPSGPRVRWGRLLALTLLGAAALLFLRWYVVGQATEAMLPPAPAAVPAPVAPAPAPAPEPTPAAGQPAEPYSEIEADLRALLLADVREVSSEESLEDALFIELVAVRLDVARVDVAVRGWTGRKRDVPKVLDLRVDLRSEPGHIDWDLGGVGLVVGKYVQRFGYEIPRFEVVFEGIAETPRRLSADPESARQLYLGRKTLLQYLRPG